MCVWNVKDQPSWYLSHCKFTHMHIVCVWVYLGGIKGHFACSIFQAAYLIQKTRPGPTWLPLMSHINHWRVCVCMTVCVEGRAVFAHTRKNIWNLWHPRLKPLIKTQINSLNAFIHPFVKCMNAVRRSLKDNLQWSSHCGSSGPPACVDVVLLVSVVKTISQVWQKWIYWSFSG